ncbi:OmpA family protein [Geomonas edaphica]|uniref:OmpA family protein n=1 Tax=Geomonas edaphica TaxID=2570226 RepID=UPI0010A8AEF4|nr:OmpA family protein [Geomonas edaphica]
MKKTLLLLLAPALMLGVHTEARAAVKAESFSLSPYVGGFTFIGKEHLETMPVYGLRAGYNFTKSIGLEAVFDYGSTEGKKYSGIGDGVDVFNYHLDALYHFMPDSQFVPYVAAGFGGQSRKYPGPAGDVDRTAFNYGLGAKYFLSDAMALRGDVRHLVLRDDGEDFHNLEYTVGMDFIFGGVKEAPAPVAAPVPAPAPAPVVVPPPPAAPTDRLTISPASVTKGEMATLSWNSENATKCVIEPGIGPVPVSGTMTVTPDSTVSYSLVCDGAGGTAKSLAKVDVVAPPPAPVPAPVVVPPPVVAPAPEPAKLCKPTVINIHFDTNKSDIKPQYHDELKALADFLKEFPKAKGTIEGHTDNVGDKAANMKLSQRRAESVRNYLIKNFDIAPDRVKAVGYGPTKPAASNKSAAGKQQNRRIESNFRCE